MKFDFLIVGAGLSGITFAERASTILGLKSLIVEKRGHIAGNAYDYYDSAGVLIHKYGPHYFRTNSDRIKDYLTRFTEWHEVRYQILSYTEGVYWRFPINLNTFEQLVGRESSESEMVEWLAKVKVPIDNPKNSEEVIISQVGWDLYNKFFKNYTIKQWAKHPKDLDASVCGRIPIRTNRNNDYLNEQFQALPKYGYTKMCQNMLDACAENCDVALNIDYRDVINSVEYKHLVYTGPIDLFYKYKYGPLPYRSLRFEHQSFTESQLKRAIGRSGPNGFWQPAVQVNYPNDNKFTRIVETKHITGQICKNTTIVKEYPADYSETKEPFYPIPSPDTRELAVLYKTLAQNEKSTSFIGRLASYQYYNMDQVVGMALAEFDRVAVQIRSDK